ncbi:MAG: aminotransferase class I/II-fold pyridoxal phosphate-dependent enzyme, partial [Clostridia bacterium]|nr:aminotransferase class I/II-fold pyridoxal phosphate-dependent enzyme [Clostridia bacterium]
SYPVDRVCERVCAAALADREYHEKTTALVVSERERLRDELLRLGFTVPDSKANFLFAGRGKKSGGEIYRALKEEGVLVRFWDAPVLRDFCRITVGSRVQNDILIEKLKKILL